MMLGLSIGSFTLLHVAISLIALLTGAFAIGGMIANRPLPGWTALFLSTTVLTSATGFLFPFERFLPSHLFGFISLALLAVALCALYARRLAGAWRAAYIVTAIMAFYLNAFVAVVQAFLKIPALKPLAPTQTEPPFAAAQALLLIACAALGWLAVKRFGRGRA